MEVNTIDIPYAPTIRLIPFGDWHVGNVNCDKEKIDEYVDWIDKNKNVYWIHMGDLADAVAPLWDETRYDEQSIDMDLKNLYPGDTFIDAQYKWVKERIAKIKDKCLGIHTGNHDDALLRKTKSHNYVKDICSTLGINYLDWSAFTVLRIGEDCNVTICSTHGSSSARMPGTKMNAMMTWAKDFEADIYLYGHTHVADAFRNICHSTDGKNILFARKVYVLTGGFLHGYQEGNSSYVEKKNLMPLKIGVVKLSIYPDKRDIHAEV